MSESDHYQEAERRLIAVTKESKYGGGTVVAGDANPRVIAVAQVEATLALVDAVRALTREVSLVHGAMP